MALLEALVVLGATALLVYGVISLSMRSAVGRSPREIAPSTGRWRAAHYDVDGQTRVVLQKLSPNGMQVLDEHTVATVHADDPDYDDKFLAAMLAARQRQAVFESEEG